MKSATSLMPPNSGLSDNTKCIGVFDPERPENKTEMRLGATFYGLTPAVVNIKIW